jgi:hypothetical protein
VKFFLINLDLKTIGVKKNLFVMSLIGLARWQKAHHLIYLTAFIALIEQNPKASQISFGMLPRLT